MDVQASIAYFLLQTSEDHLRPLRTSQGWTEVGIWVEKHPPLFHPVRHVLNLIGRPGGDAVNVGLVLLLHGGEADQDVIEGPGEFLGRHLLSVLRPLLRLVLHSIRVDEEDPHLA